MDWRITISLGNYQVRDFFEKEIKPDLPQELNKVTITLCNAYRNNTGRVVSTLYQGLEKSRGTSTLYVRDRWVKESKMPLTEEDWFNICDVQRTTTSSRMWKEFCWKNMIRFFITPKTKSKITTTQQTCWRRCGEQNAGHTHVFWECTKMRNYWNDVWVELKTILGYELPKSCEILYLCNLTRKNVQYEDEYLVKILLAAAKKAITRKWGREDPPTRRNWLDTVEEIINMERFTYILRLQQTKFDKKCEKWTDHKSQSRDTTENLD